MPWFSKHAPVPPPVPPVPLHPYYPTSLILTNYKPNQRDSSSIATEFSLELLVILVFTWVVSTRLSRCLNAGEKLAILWFVLCGTLHIFFEGYFVLNRETLISKQDLFAQLWKEYALSDSRYLTGDSVVLCAEAITCAVLGPLSYLTAVAIARVSPWRHSLQCIVSLCHIYSDLLYLSTSIVELLARGISHSRPEARYFWFYFLSLNSIWLVVPAILMWQGVLATNEAASAWQQVDEMYQSEASDAGVKANGRSKSI